MGFPIIRGKNQAEQIIEKQTAEEYALLEDTAKEFETILQNKGIKNYQIEPVLKIFADRHSQRINNMSLNDEIVTMREYEYTKPS